MGLRARFSLKAYNKLLFGTYKVAMDVSRFGDGRGITSKNKWNKVMFPVETIR